MAENKKSFVMYADYIENFEMLSNEQAGKLIKHLLAYVNDLDPDEPDPLLKMAALPIKKQMRRDLEKWETIKQKRSEAGRKGGKKTQSKANQAKAKSVNQNEANQAVTVTVTDTVTDTVITSSNDDDVYYTIDRLKIEYLKNQRLCNSVVENQKLKSTHQLSELLTEFNKHLDQLGTSTKTWQDYTKHFLNWMKKKTDPVNQQNAYQTTAPKRF